MFSLVSNDSCFLYRTDLTSRKADKLTARTEGCESDPSFSRDGKLIAYSVTNGNKEKSSIWIIHSDGTNDHRVMAATEDSSHPVFALDDKRLYFVRAGFFGHYSPIAREAKHDLDIFSVPIDGGEAAALTQQHFYSLQSLSMSPDGKSLLVSTTRYPIGPLLEEYVIDKPTGPHKVFQPHVPGEPSSGPSIGSAVYMPNGFYILFIAASNTHGGDYDYNVYRMSSVTGSELQQLTLRTGMANDVQAAPDGRSAIFTAGNEAYLVDLQTHAVKPLPMPVLTK